MDTLSQFYVPEDQVNESNFKESFTIEQIKAHEGGQRFVALPCVDRETKQPTGRFFFACGRIRGYVSKKTAQKLMTAEGQKTLGTLVVSHVISDKLGADGKPEFDGLMLHEEGVQAIHAW